MNVRVAAVLLLSCCANIAIAQDADEYLDYCASCHGPTAKGHGPIAASLKTPPTDLTLLTKHNEGAFPYFELRKIIDGRTTDHSHVRAHGPKEMPVWGAAFRWQSDEKEQIVKTRILNIIDYLHSVQEE